MPVNTKAVLRDHLHHIINAMPIQLRRQADAHMWKHILNHLDIVKEYFTPGPAMLGVYYPLRHEVDIHPLFDMARAQGWDLALPVIIKRQAPLIFRTFETRTILEKSLFSIPHPPADRPEVTPSVCLLPCIGLHPAGYRLGSGGGFYDRTLAHHPDIYTIGVGYDVQLSLGWEPEAHDRRLDCIITEKGVKTFP